MQMWLTCSVIIAASSSAWVEVMPSESDALLANPGMGWQTFHCFADSDRTLEGLPSGSAYFRLSWAELEPTEGDIQFAKVDDLLQRARKAGQRLALRIMCAGTCPWQPSYSPSWLTNHGVQFLSYQYLGKEGPFWTPDMNDARWVAFHTRLIRKIGERLDGHPDLDVLDIGSVGLWGEWHMSGTGIPMPRPEVCQAVIDAYFEAFPRTPKLMLIGAVDVRLTNGLNALQYGISRGAGWRADCLGDLGEFSRTWNHMRDFYPRAIVQGGAEDAWKSAPVAFESCSDMRRWVQEGWDVKAIFRFALECHASYVNNKSTPIPAVARSEVEQLVRRLGYRLVVRRVRFPASVRRGDPLRMEMEWINRGVAPPYRDGWIGLRIGDGDSALRVPTGVSIRGWLPGERKIEVRVATAQWRVGPHALALGIVEADGRNPAVRLAVEGTDAEGWLPLGHVTVVE